jgi:fatty acid CoA ligase FadD9
MSRRRRSERAVSMPVDNPPERPAARRRFEIFTHHELWDRAGAIASAWTNKPVRPGDRVCVLGFSSVDHAIIDVALIRLGAVAIPLRAGAAVAQLRPVVAEAQPGVIASSIDYLSDALELALTGHAPTRLVVFDHEPEVDHHQEAVKAARNRFTHAGRPVIVETLAEVISRGKRLPAAPMCATPDVVVTYLNNLKMLGLV